MYLYGVLLHGERSVDVVQLVVEAARVAHRLAVRVAPPQRRGGGLAVGARHARSLGAHLRKHALLVAGRAGAALHATVMLAREAMVVSGRVRGARAGGEGAGRTPFFCL